MQGGPSSFLVFMLSKTLWRCALLIVVLAACGPGSSRADAEAADGLEPITVLGDAQPAAIRPNLEFPTVIDGEAIARSGVTTIDAYLQRLPMFGSQGVNQSQNAGGYGVSFVDLRNLNFNRTLVLIDGRRVVLSGITTDEAVDVANVPAALVDRIEVMPYGSEPRYGADAVAGVVNIILKHDLSGLQVSAASAASTYGDGVGGDLAATYGQDFGQGNLTLSGSFTQREALPQSDRGWARDPILTAAFGLNGVLAMTRGSAASLAGYPILAGGSSGVVSNGYDTSLSSDLQGGLSRSTVNLQAHEPLSDSTQLFVEAGFSNKVSTTLLPPQILGVTGTLKNPDGFVIPASDPFNPYGQAVTLRRVLAEVGAQSTRSDNELFRVVAGIEGTWGSDTAWSLSLNHGDSRTSYKTDNAVNLTRALQTVSADPSDCPANQGCGAADYFGAGSLSPTAADYIRYTDITQSQYLETEVQAQVSRSVSVLGRTPWKLAVGAEYRREQGQTMPSSVVLAGEQAGPDSTPTTGRYASRELFMDLDLPLLEDRPFAKSLRADLSARHVGTDLFGDFTVWKLDSEWVIGSVMTFRTGLGTARRVPAITEAFGGSTATPTDVTDPCDPAAGLVTNPIVAANCRTVGLNGSFRQDSALITVDNGGNPHLKPEASRSLDAGLVITLDGPGALTLSADYYRIEIHDAIDSYADFNPSYIPDQCYSIVNLSSPLCSLVTRIPAGPGAGQISRILAPDENIGAIDTDGIDLGVGFRTDLGSLGTLRVDWHATVLLDYRVQETPGAAYIQEAGTFPNLSSAGSLTRFRSLFLAAEEQGPWTVGWTVRYIGGASVLGQDPATPLSRAPGVFYHDVSLTRRLGAYTIDCGIDNLANQRPPTLIDGVTNTNTNTYDVVGRSFHVRGEARF